MVYHSSLPGTPEYVVRTVPLHNGTAVYASFYTRVFSSVETLFLAWPFFSLSRDHGLDKGNELM